jgi:hypothetical protein
MAIPDMYAHAQAATHVLNKRNVTHNSKPDIQAIQMQWRGREKMSQPIEGVRSHYNRSVYGFLKTGHTNMQVKEFTSKIAI